MAVIVLRSVAFLAFSYLRRGISRSPGSLGPKYIYINTCVYLCIHGSWALSRTFSPILILAPEEACQYSPEEIDRKQDIPFYWFFFIAFMIPCVRRSLFSYCGDEISRIFLAFRLSRSNDAVDKLITISHIPESRISYKGTRQHIYFPMVIQPYVQL